MSDGDSNKDLLHELSIDRGQRDDDDAHGPRWPRVVLAIVLVMVVAAAPNRDAASSERLRVCPE